ncbi:N-acetyl-gamma-glutamyl-phosphate reductase [[Clostridium] ultunense Esp]|nr:N-acetyl-gamma-glutamyl-phosphate reductase [[Clostridium] ultunense Esp]
MKIALIGTGYSSIELVRILLQHPNAELKKVITHSQGGKELQEMYPHLASIADFSLEDLEMDSFRSGLDVVFLGTPAGVSGKWTPKLLDLGVRVIDLSGDYRLKDPKEYEAWYKKEASLSYLGEAVYGLSEIYKEEIKGARLVANPGCYPTASLLTLIPALKEGLISHEGIIIDAKSGISGAGRGVSLSLHYSEVNENLKAYKVGIHQHIPEIEQELSKIKMEKVFLTFIPHLAPMTRGILVTVYGRRKSNTTTRDLIELYREFYRGSPFVRIRGEGSYPATKEVYGSNYCDIGVYVDERSDQIILFGAIDNMVKGAAGQAVQNMNLMFGLDERTGLLQTPIYP